MSKRLNDWDNQLISINDKPVFGRVTNIYPAKGENKACHGRYNGQQVGLDKQTHVWYAI